MHVFYTFIFEFLKGIGRLKGKVFSPFLFIYYLFLFFIFFISQSPLKSMKKEWNQKGSLEINYKL